MIGGDNTIKMDKKTIIGLLLMVAVFVGYSFYVDSEREKVVQTTAEFNKPMDQYQIQKEAELKEQQRIKSEEELTKHGLNNRSKAESEIIDVKNNYMTIRPTPFWSRYVYVVEESERRLLAELIKAKMIGVEELRSIDGRLCGESL